MRPRWFALLLLFALVPARAALYRCEVDGRPLFSDRLCGADAVRLPIDDHAPPPASVGLRPGERRLLQQFEKRDAEARRRRDAAFDRDVRREQRLKAECARLQQQLAGLGSSGGNWDREDGLRARMNALQCGAH